MDIATFLMSLAMGAFYGLQASLIGYLAQGNMPLSWSVIFDKKFWVYFEPVKAIKTVILGMVMGVLGVFATVQLPQSFLDVVGPTFPAAIPLFLDLAYTGAILGTNKLMQLIIRRTPIITAYNKFKEKLGIPVEEPEPITEEELADISS